MTTFLWKIISESGHFGKSGYGVAGWYHTRRFQRVGLFDALWHFLDLFVYQLALWYKSLKRNPNYYL